MAPAVAACTFHSGTASVPAQSSDEVRTLHLTGKALPKSFQDWQSLSPKNPTLRPSWAAHLSTKVPSCHLPASTHSEITTQSAVPSLPNLLPGLPHPAQFSAKDILASCPHCCVPPGRSAPLQLVVVRRRPEAPVYPSPTSPHSGAPTPGTEP